LVDHTESNVVHEHARKSYIGLAHSMKVNKPMSHLRRRKQWVDFTNAHCFTKPVTKLWCLSSLPWYCVDDCAILAVRI